MDRQPPDARRRAVRAALAGALALSMTPAAAQEAAQDDAPPPGFLVGEYELVGRAPGFEGAALLDWVRIVPAPDGTLLLDACRLGLGTLRADWRVEAPLMPLIGRLGEW